MRSEGIYFPVLVHPSLSLVTDHRLLSCSQEAYTLHCSLLSMADHRLQSCSQKAYKLHCSLSSMTDHRLPSCSLRQSWETLTVIQMTLRRTRLPSARRSLKTGSKLQTSNRYPVKLAGNFPVHLCCCMNGFNMMSHIVDPKILPQVAINQSYNVLVANIRRLTL